mmetsp:Transcript_66161/g.215235  ORF Transcript_66161/g.215235 Transcript_66161/m.215235 type:complete len:705 (+) Transcript_66161:80-2194(+)
MVAASACAGAAAQAAVHCSDWRSVPGLQLFPDFVREDEEAGLVDWLDAVTPPWRNQQAGVQTKYYSKQFGIVPTLQPRSTRPPDPSLGEAQFPTDGPFGALAERFKEQGAPWASALRGFQPNEANTNDYRREEGHFLAMHWDDRKFYSGPICVVSLLAGATMTFRLGGHHSNFRRIAGDGVDSGYGGGTAAVEAGGAAEGAKGKVEERVVRVELPRRSLMVQTGAARFEWQHGIPDPHDFAGPRRIGVIVRHAAICPSKPLRATRAPVSTVAAAVLAADQAGEGVVTNGGGSAPTPSSSSSSAAPGGGQRSPFSALILSSQWPDPNVSGSGLVMQGRLRALGDSGLGLRVTLASEGEPGTAMDRAEREFGVRCARLTANDEVAIREILESAAPDIVIFDGFNVEERYSHFVNQFVLGAMRVLDLQDFNTLRFGRETMDEKGVDVRQMGAFRPDSGIEDLCRELTAMHRNDCTLATSEAERRLLVDNYNVPAAKVVVAPWGYPPLEGKSAKIPGFAVRTGAMFIADWRHRPNRDAAKWLVEEVWPRVHKQLPEVELTVFGANPSLADTAMSRPDINAVVAGTCGSVEKAMRQHRLLVAPLRYGAGMKGKVIDAFRHGLVPVTTEVGAEGLLDIDADGAFPGIWAEADAENFAAACVQAYEDEVVWGRHQAHGSRFVARTFDLEANGKALAAALLARWQALEDARS